MFNLKGASEKTEQVQTLALVAIATTFISKLLDIRKVEKLEEKEFNNIKGEK